MCWYNLRYLIESFSVYVLENNTDQWYNYKSDTAGFVYTVYIGDTQHTNLDWKCVQSYI